MQREVAARLGLESVLRTPEDLVGPTGLFQAALELARHSISHPPELVVPAYDELSVLGVARGCTTILSGSGGDEWLLPPPAYAVDRILSLDVLALTELCRAWAGYWPGRQPLSAMRGVLWRSGVRSLGLSLFTSITGRLAPEVPLRMRRARAEQRIPAWLIPERDLRRCVVERMAEQTPLHAPGAALEAERRLLLDLETLSVGSEVAFEAEARTHASYLSPLLDADVVDYLHHLKPRELITGGHAKAPARDILSRFLPGLATSWPRTVLGNALWRDTIRDQGARAWSLSGGVSSLAELGLVDASGVRATLSDAGAPVTLSALVAAWRALSLESWLGGIADRKNVL
jgi:asparagine synthase